MDTRVLKTGLTRIRFKLSPEGYAVVKKAIIATNCNYPHTALENIFLFYICISDYGSDNLMEKKSYVGNKRLLVRLYPDQLSIITQGLNMLAGPESHTENSLLHICKFFLNHFDGHEMDI